MLKNLLYADYNQSISKHLIKVIHICTYLPQDHSREINMHVSFVKIRAVLFKQVFSQTRQYTFF